MSGTDDTTVRIFDHWYRIASASADAVHIQEAASLLDDRMRQVASASRRKVPLEIAILAAMEIGDEVLGARGARDRILTDADERLRRFTCRLENGAAGELPPGDDDPPSSRF